MTTKKISLTEIQSHLRKVDGGRYTLEKAIGKGSYGVVISAFDNVTEKRVAIKRVSPEIFNDTFLALRILREISMLAHFRYHDNVMGLIDIIPLPDRDFDVLYIIMEVLDNDMKSLMRSAQPLTEEHVQFFLHQLLRGLYYIHSAGVIHRDITPANILVNINCDLRICDFGLAKEDTAQENTDYVCMRWYRAPELVMEATKYTAAVDMWACGCILGQLFSDGFKVVFPGRDRIKQLGTILEVIGTPTEADMSSIGSDMARKYIRKHHSNLPSVNFAERFHLPDGSPLSPDALDLLKRMLTFNPSSRISVVDALRHPYLSNLYDPDQDEQACHAAFNLDVSEYDINDIHVIKNLIFDKVLEIKHALQEEELSGSCSVASSAANGNSNHMQEDTGNDRVIGSDVVLNVVGSPINNSGLLQQNNNNNNGNSNSNSVSTPVAPISCPPNTGSVDAILHAEPERECDTLSEGTWDDE